MKIKCKKIPSNIVKKAEKILNQYMNGDIHARKTYRQGYLVLNVTHNYRLLFRNDIWNVLSHEAYNKIKER